MKIISKETARTINGGALYRCIWCGYTSNSYWRTYANALACVTRCMESSKQHCINFTQYIKQKKREGLQQQLRTIPKENIKMLKENPE